VPHYLTRWQDPAEGLGLMSATRGTLDGVDAIALGLALLIFVLLAALLAGLDRI